MKNIWQVLEEEILDDLDAEMVYGGKGEALRIQLEDEEKRASHAWVQGRGVGTVVTEQSHMTVACVWEVCRICGVYRDNPDGSIWWDDSMRRTANHVSCEEMVVRRVLDE